MLKTAYLVKLISIKRYFMNIKFTKTVARMSIKLEPVVINNPKLPFKLHNSS